MVGKHFHGRSVVFSLRINGITASIGTCSTACSTSIRQNPRSSLPRHLPITIYLHFRLVLIRGFINPWKTFSCRVWRQQRERSRKRKGAIRQPLELTGTAGGQNSRVKQKGGERQTYVKEALLLPRCEPHHMRAKKRHLRLFQALEKVQQHNLAQDTCSFTKTQRERHQIADIRHANGLQKRSVARCSGIDAGWNITTTVFSVKVVANVPLRSSGIPSQ